MESTVVQYEETSLDDIPRIVEQVATKANEWHKVISVEEKIHLLQQIIENTIEHCEEWVVAQQQSRGVMDPTINKLHGYGYIDILSGGPATLGSYAHGILTSLREISQTGKPPPPKSVRSTTNGKTIVTVFPDGVLESLEALGMKGELVLSGNSSSAQKHPQQDDIEQGHVTLQQTYEEVTVGGIAAILAAGNFDRPVDLLSQLFLKGRVCAYKPNPVNHATVTVLEKILEPLITPGYVAFVKGGANVGATLVQNQQLDEIVLTGSAHTLTKIQWGSTPQEQLANQRSNQPLLTTPICSELGAVNSWIIVPGSQWNEQSVDDHACAMAFAKLGNSAHTCVSPQVYVIPEDWPYRQLFLHRLRYWLGQHPGGPPFYPGSSELHAFFLKEHPNAELVGNSNYDDDEVYPNQQRPILIPGTTLDDKILLQREAWCPVLCELPIPYEMKSEQDSLPFLQKAIDCVATNLSGSLSITILIDDDTMEKNQKELDDIVADMPFGQVGINIWPILSHSMAQLRWGAYPGYTVSGTGYLGNARFFRNPEKAVLKAPFSYLPRKMVQVVPPSRAARVFSRFTTYRLRPNLITQAALFSAVLFGL